MDFRERVNVGYSLDAIVIVQAKYGHLDDSNRGTGDKGMGEEHFSGVRWTSFGVRLNVND